MTPSQSQDCLPIERQATARQQDGHAPELPQSITAFADVHAWVLLADPGAGKTSVFLTECAESAGCYRTASDFLHLDMPANWTEPIFIDGLDEITANKESGRTLFDQIRGKLQQLGLPKFRISCREADWRGNSDTQALVRLVGAQTFKELHLNPLVENDVRTLVAHWLSVDTDQAADFIRQAQRRDLDGLLDNPQTLRMLVTAYQANQGAWPASKLQTYEMACTQLAKEHNEEHLANHHYSAVPEQQIMQAAHYLCAVMLLSGSASVVASRVGADSADQVVINTLHRHGNEPSQEACNAAMHSKLFRYQGQGAFCPVHRTVAEYLGAKHVCARLQAGLPVGRVWALMLGVDAGVVPALRGLHAWLAAVSTGDTRKQIIDHDPLGVVVHGDVRHFTRPEKLHIFEALKAEATRYTYFRSQNWTSSPFGALATLDMQEDFKRWLDSDDRSPAHMALLDCVMDALQNGEPMPELAQSLERIVRSNAYWGKLRKAAIELCLSYSEKQNSWDAILVMLDGIKSNAIDDPDDELLGLLLDGLYPHQISTTQVWQYFRTPKRLDFFGSYRFFWFELPKIISQNGQTALSLDALSESGFKLSNAYEGAHTAGVIGSLLVNGVSECGLIIDASRFNRWLSLGLDTDSYSPLDTKQQEFLSNWLSDNPKVYKELFEQKLHALTQADVSIQLWQVRNCLYGAKNPSDTVAWYLSLASALPNIDLRRQLVWDAYHFTKTASTGDLAITLIEDWTTTYPTDAVWLSPLLLCPYPSSATDERYRTSIRNNKNQIQNQEQKKFDDLEKTLPTFETRAHLGALAFVAKAYLDASNNNDTPLSRLEKKLNDDLAWVQLALHGLRKCLFRDDVPSYEEVISLSAKDGLYNIAIPCLAAMQLRYTEMPETALDLSDTTLNTVTAFRLLNGYSETPAWFEQLVRKRPDVLERVMADMMRAQIAGKKEHVDGLYALARKAEYADIAKKITLPLANGFPIKAAEKQLGTLRMLILALLKYASPEQLQILIDKKLSLKSMDVAQKTYWWAVAILVNSDKYLTNAKAYIQMNQARESHLLDLVDALTDRGFLHLEVSGLASGFLIETLGKVSIPSWADESGMVTKAIEAGRFVAALITNLSNDPSELAQSTLVALRARTYLHRWYDPLDRAIYEQNTTRRKALFTSPSVLQVYDSLANAKPANAADLWALTVDHLKQLAAKIRDGNTNDYGQYWDGDTPKIEDECRNAFLSDLKLLLATSNVSAEPEGVYADLKRADIRVSTSAFQIPIEIKRDRHPDLWTAIVQQLVAKYCREASSGGYGIYIVFWFDGEIKKPPNDGGKRPRTPLELEQRLKDTIPENLKNKIAVLVIDCSKPIKSVSR